jgi:integrase/recombinase XerD
MTKFSIYLSKKRTNSRGEAPIYFKIKLGRVIEKSTRIFVDPITFDRQKKRITGNSKPVQDANAKLDRLCSFIQELGENATETAINRIFSNVLDGKESGTFISIIEAYLASLNTRINNSQADSILPVTYEKNIFLSRTLTKYLESKKQINLPVTRIDKAYIGNLIKYFRDELKYSCGHTNRIVKFIKSALRYSINEGLCLPTNALTVKLKAPEKEIIFLNQEQIKSLTLLNLKNSALEKIRDIFIVQCYSGLSYADLSNLNKDWLYEDDNGNVFIKYKRAKTKTMATVPVQKPLMLLLEKYDYKLPVISNQKYNQYLKLVGLAANLPFPLTSHIGRKTCGSMLLNNGVNIYTVKTILGHSSVKTTESHYAQLNEVGIVQDLYQARNINLVNNHVAKQIQLFGS